MATKNPTRKVSIAKNSNLDELIEVLTSAEETRKHKLNIATIICSLSLLSAVIGAVVGMFFIFYIKTDFNLKNFSSTLTAEVVNFGFYKQTIDANGGCTNSLNNVFYVVVACIGLSVILFAFAYFSNHKLQKGKFEYVDLEGNKQVVERSITLKKKGIMFTAIQISSLIGIIGMLTVGILGFCAIPSTDWLSSTSTTINVTFLVSLSLDTISWTLSLIGNILFIALIVIMICSIEVCAWIYLIKGSMILNDLKEQENNK